MLLLMLMGTNESEDLKTDQLAICLSESREGRYWSLMPRHSRASWGANRCAKLLPVRVAPIFSSHGLRYRVRTVDTGYVTQRRVHWKSFIGYTFVQEKICPISVSDLQMTPYSPSMIRNHSLPIRPISDFVLQTVVL